VSVNQQARMTPPATAIREEISKADYSKICYKEIFQLKLVKYKENDYFCGVILWDD